MDFTKHRQKFFLAVTFLLVIQFAICQEKETLTSKDSLSVNEESSKIDNKFV